jgi:hypothetical protein
MDELLFALKDFCNKKIKVWDGSRFNCGSVPVQKRDERSINKLFPGLLFQFFVEQLDRFYYFCSYIRTYAHTFAPKFCRKIIP